MAFCPNCGSQLNDQSLFCRNCGAEVSKANAQAQAYAQATSPEFQTNVQQPQKVNQIVFILLAVFLGCFGAQKFYTKKYVFGVICIVFSWTGIPTIIGIIEGIIAATKNADPLGFIEV